MCSASSVEDAVCRRYGVVSTSPPGLTSTMDVIVIVCHEFELTVSEKQADAMHLWSDPSTASNALLLVAAGQQYEQTTEFVYFGGAISESAELDTEIKRRIGAAWAGVRTYSYCVPPTTSYFCASSAFGSRAAPGSNLYHRMGRFSRGSVPKASKRQFGSANLGSPGRQGDSRLSKRVIFSDRCRLGWTISRKTSKPLGRSRAKAKDGSGLHSELLSRMDTIG